MATASCAPPPKRRRRNSESLSDADESRLGQYIEAFKKIHRSDNRARAGIGELVHLAARSKGKHRLRDSLCKARRYLTVMMCYYHSYTRIHTLLMYNI